MTLSHHDILASLYRAATGCEALSLTPIKGSGSNRLYYKIYGGDAPTLIGVIGSSIAENEAFIYLSQHFSEKGINVPKVLAVSPDRSAYVQEFAGDRQLYDLLSENRRTAEWGSDAINLLAAAMRSLARIQYLGAQGLDWSKCFPLEALDRKSVMWDLNYFKYCFLKPSGIDVSEPSLEEDFNRLADLLMAGESDTFMYRDFQSRNIMVSDDGRLTLIDFQGGRRGPAAYDVASFLWQARAKYPDDLRSRLVDVYLEEASKYTTLSAEDFHCQLRICILFRMLQVLGTYGFRGLYERKAAFMQSIPAALGTASQYLPVADFPTLASAIDLACRKYAPKDEPDFQGLTLTVESFSYKKGLPEDPSGNGGGFVFDCRALPNPGRYEQYRNFTGRDREVIDFLEPLPEVDRFISLAAEMVAASLQVYIARGFTHLSASFGCTGGQHRSVYCAEQLARRIHNIFHQIRVHIIHREQSINLYL